MRGFFPSLISIAFCLLPIQAFAKKSFDDSELASDAVRLNAQMQSAPPNENLLTSSPTAQALRQDPQNSRQWLAYSTLLSTQVAPRDNRYFVLLHNALTAAYIAYQRATKSQDEAAALVYIGNIYATQHQWRPALNVYRDSLDLVHNTDVRNYYIELREKYGFRLTNYTIDNESKVPRACFQYSEKLDKSLLDFGSFVSVANMPQAAVSAQDNQLCVEGLAHGQSYHVVVRRGVPSSVREHSLHSSTYDLYIKDRSPQVHFSGKNYILPKLGQQGIPILSVNTDKVNVDIMRVGDRNLLQTIHSGEFLSQLGSWATRKLIDKNGVKVWSGILDVAASVNQDVVTAFPVLKAVGTLQPGLYALVATPGDSSPSAPNPVGTPRQRATQWFVVSDLGLTSFNSPDGLHVLVRGLATAGVLDHVTLRLLARDNEVLATTNTTENGLADFAPGLLLGKGGQAPSLLIATNAAGDYNFLDLSAAPFDLTDRGDKGPSANTGLQALLFPERGVYRAGEPVHITALLRDTKGDAVMTTPLILSITRPDGVEYKREVLADGGLGGRSFTLPLLKDAAVGTWHMAAYTDPNLPAIGEASFLVEDYVPDHLDMVASPTQAIARSGEPISLNTTTRYLYGAKGSNLQVSGDIAVETAEEAMLPALKGYEFGLTDEPFQSMRAELAAPVTTDADGKAKITLMVPDARTPRALQAKISLHVAEPGGHAITRQVTLAILPKHPVLGIKKDFNGILGQGDTAGFRLAMFDANGARMAQRGIGWALYRITRNLQFFRTGSDWNFENVKTTAKVASGAVDITADKNTALQLPTTFGEYRLEVKVGNQQTAFQTATSVTFEAGYRDGGDGTRETPDQLAITLDKAQYQSGDIMHVHVNARFAGQGTFAVAASRFQIIKTTPLVKGDNLVKLPVNAKWGSGAYLVALEHRPLDVAAKRMPGRAMGLTWFGLNLEQHKLSIRLGQPATMRPHQTLDLPVQLVGLKPGQQAYVTVAAVDVGILNLTQYSLPDGFAALYGQHQLSSQIRDIYGKLIDGMQGTLGAIRSGGDSGAGVGNAPKPSQAPLALYSGPMAVDANGKAHVQFAIPQFNGTVRLMAIAWTQDAVGTLSQDVIVRDPVVVDVSLPRFLNLEDYAQFHIQVDNVAGEAGDYQISLNASPGLAMLDTSAKLHLEKGQRGSLDVPVTAKSLGPTQISIQISGPQYKAEQTASLDILAGTSPLFGRTIRAIEPGASISISKDLLDNFVAGTGAVRVAVASVGGLNLPALLHQLDTYPLRCSEQTVSRAWPLLNATHMSGLTLSPVGQTIQNGIARVLARQNSTGGFGLWSASDDADLWLSAYIMDFLTHAREAGHAVPPRAFQSGLDFLANGVANSGDIRVENEAGVAYALYDLARNGRPVMGDLRFMASTEIDRFSSPLALSQIAASFALLGDKAPADRLFQIALTRLQQLGQGADQGANNSAIYVPDYGSSLRDSAALVSLAS